MNPHVWCSATGIVSATAAMKASLNGVRNGEATSVAIMVLPSGRRSMRGSASRV